MGTNGAPILTNLYLSTKLETVLKEKTKNHPVKPIFFRRYIKSNVEYCILEFNNLVKSIKIDKFKYGSKVEYMDLIIFKGNRSSKLDFSTLKSFRRRRIFTPTFRKKVTTKNTP